MQEMEMSQTSANNKNTLMIGGLLALVAVIGVGVFLVQSREAETNTKMASPTPVVNTVTPPSPTTDTIETTSSPTTTASPTTDEVRTINLEAGSFYFKPDTIRVKKGETVKIVMTSKDMMHDFNIDELNVKLPITKSGETNTVEFTATKTGTFEYYCSVGQHRANGQVGTLIVKE